MCKAFSLSRAAFNKASRLGPGGADSAWLRAALANWVRRSVREGTSLTIEWLRVLAGARGSQSPIDAVMGRWWWNPSRYISVRRFKSASPAVAALLLLSTRLFPKELFTVGATEDSNRPLGWANRVNERHWLTARPANRRQFGFLLRHRTRTQEQRAWFLFFRPILARDPWVAGFEAVRWMLQSAGGLVSQSSARHE